MQRASSSLIIKKTRNAKKPNTKPWKSDGDRLKLRNRTLKYGTWNVRGCRNKMEGIIRERNIMKKRKDYANKKFEWLHSKYATRKRHDSTMLVACNRPEHNLKTQACEGSVLHNGKAFPLQAYGTQRVLGG
jgi:hypothetical protein